MNNEDELPCLDHEIYPEKSIFFLETSNNGGLDSRQACAVESAGRANVNWQINVLFTEPIAKFGVRKTIIRILQKLGNVKAGRIHVKEYTKDTLAESILGFSGVIKKSKWPVHHTADILRLVTLNKYGGVYLDLDMYTVKSFDSLPKNWIGLESDTITGSAALAMSKDGVGRNFTETALRYILRDFRPMEWSYHGPLLIQRVLEKICSTKDLMAMTAKTCNGFEIFKPEYFYPVNYDRWWRYFQTQEIDLKQAYAVHMWNKMSHAENVAMGSLFAKIAQQYCPTVYKMYGQKFGSM